MSSNTPLILYTHMIFIIIMIIGQAIVNETHKKTMEKKISNRMNESYRYFIFCCYSVFVFFSDQHNKQKILSLCVAFVFIFTIISIKFFFLLFYWSVFHRWLIRISLFSLILKKLFFVKLFTTFFLFFSFSLSFNYQDFFLIIEFQFCNTTKINKNVFRI